MEYVNTKKLEAVANFLTNIEVNGDYLCGSLLECLNESFDVPKCTDDEAFCLENCPMKSITNFVKWIKEPDGYVDRKVLKKQKNIYKI
jgi:hypothetical protein